MKSGAAIIDITPTTTVFMDGMIREQKSIGVHDPIHARALVLSDDHDATNSFVIVSVEVCGLSEAFCRSVREIVTERTGIPIEHIILAATHTHSGPATVGYFNPVEEEYLKELSQKLIGLIIQSVEDMLSAAVGYGSGQENSISHYRRLLTENNDVIMNWEETPPGKSLHSLGKSDPAVGVLKIVNPSDPKEVHCILFNHAGHPNVMSGENYLISADYPGVAAQLLESKFKTMAMFVNGAQGSVDIDGLKHRDWEGVDRAGTALGKAAAEVVATIVPSTEHALKGGYINYSVPARIITDGELTWAETMLQSSSGPMHALADGVGDDYKALLYKKLHELEADNITIEQTCIAVGDCAFISFPGELFTEIGLQIKAASPFTHTCIIGLANGLTGYIPTAKAITEGGYAVDTRRVDAAAESIIIEHSITLLKQVYEK